ncbi:extensin [Rosa rugosa]|uniref:extensin n=1 Tax=Rosa rugosa TaxID=74645 RepID=UPI002B412B7E|nr:extensin [Rosa rugosa]
METLLVVEHKNQYYSRVKPHGPGRVGPSPSKSFRGINCRTFQSGTGILPTPPPLKSSSTTTTSTSTPVSKKPCPPSAYSPKTPTPSADSQFDAKPKFYSDSKAVSRSNVRTNPIPINARNLKKEKPFNESFSFSELWAGPAYSNSPPPSSLPIPKFSVRPKRTVSLELPSSVSAIEMHPIAKSAPPSPTREHSSSKRDLFHNADSATRTLRRILNLDVDDE